MDKSQLSEYIVEFIGRPTTQSFLKTAQQYINIVENAKNLKLDEFLEKMQPVLPELYLSGLNLDLIDVRYSTDKKCFQAVSDGFFDKIHESLAAIFIKYDNTWVASNPMGDKHQNVKINFLDENYEQIYLELKNEIAKMNKKETNEAFEDAFWQMKISFINFWGKHCINAIQALHYIKYEKYDIYTMKLLTDPN